MAMKLKRKNEATSLIPKKKKVDPRKTLGVVLLIGAALIAFVLMPFLFNKKDECKDIYVANSLIEPGTVITEDMITLKEMGIYGISSYYTKSDKEQLIGERAAFDIVKGDVITTSKLGGNEKSTLGSITKSGKSIVTISINSNAAGLSTHLKAGDTVNIWNLASSDWGTAVGLNPVLKNVKVYSAENAAGYSTEDRIRDINGKDNSVSTITFIVDNEEEARALINAEYSGGIHIELVGRE